MGAYVLARVPDRHLMATPVVAAFSFGLSLVAFSQSHIYWLSFLLLMPCAFSLLLLGGSTNSIIQLLSRDEMRGRVVALYAMSFLGMMPWGSLVLGWVAEHAGISVAVTLGGSICILGALVAGYDRRGGQWSARPTNSSASFQSRAFVSFAFAFSAMPKIRVSTRMTLPSRIGTA